MRKENDVSYAIQSDANKYSIERWQTNSIYALPNMLKVKNTINLFIKSAAKNGISVDIFGEKMHFEILINNKNKPLIIRGDDILDFDDVGRYVPDKNTFFVNHKAFDDGRKTYEMCQHEVVHYLQTILRTQDNHYEKDSAKHDFLSILESSYKCRDTDKMEAFGITCGNRLYIQKDIEKDKEEDPIGLYTKAAKMSQVFYPLMTVERHAFAAARRFAEKGGLASQDINEQSIYYYSGEHLDAIINQFKDVCQCKHLSDKQLFDIIDMSELNILKGREPSSDLEAFITYELAALLALQNKQIDIRRYNELTDSKVRDKTLSEWGRGYAIPWNNTRIGEYVFLNDKASLLCGVEQITNMPPNERRSNPEAVFFAILNDGEVVTEHFTNEDWEPCVIWWRSNKNYFTEKTREDIAQLLGQEFIERIATFESHDQNLVVTPDIVDERIEEHDEFVFDDFDFNQDVDLQFDDGREIK